MIVDARVLCGLCLACASASALAAAADAAAEKQQCIQRELDKGHEPGTSDAICKVRKLFQNRVRFKPDEEAVEMTVGSPPMISDDTDTPGAGKWELNFVFDAEWSGAQRGYEAPLLDFNYGIGERLQLKYEVPFVVQRDSPSGGPSQTDRGVGDSTVGLKYRFYDDDASGVSLALYPQLRVRTPGAARAVSEGGSSVILPLLLTAEFSRASISANLGVEKSSQADRADYFASFGAGTRLNDKVALMAEIAAQNLDAASERRLIFNLGLKVKLAGKQSILASIGHDLRAPDGASSNSYATIAYQRLIGD